MNKYFSKIYVIFFVSVASFLYLSSAYGSSFQWDNINSKQKTDEQNTRVDKLSSLSYFNQKNKTNKTNKESPLPSDKAFVFKVNVIKGQIILHWDIAKGYYLYKDKIHIYYLKNNQRNVIFNKISYSPFIRHSDPYFGLSHIFLNKAVIHLNYKIPFNKKDESKIYNFVVQYQGCKKNTVCYPPITKTLTINLVNYTSSITPFKSNINKFKKIKINNILDNSTDTFLKDKHNKDNISNNITYTDNNSHTNSLNSNHNGDVNKKPLVLILLGFFVSGLLLSFTPCVFPMIPILLGIIGTQKDNNKRQSKNNFLLSLIYVLSSTIVFTLLGVISGFIGSGVQYIFQSPWFIIPFALLFVVLSLSMFGLYELKLPSFINNKINNISNKQAKGTLLGTSIMGLLSGLLVGPCVTPPLVGAILYISQLGMPLIGGLSLFLLSLGMGVPLIIMGTFFGHILPKAGKWMINIQKIFGVMFLGLSIWFLSRIVEPQFIMLLTGILLIGCSAYLFKTYGHKLLITISCVLFIIGTTEIIGFTMNNKNILYPLSNIGYKHKNSKSFNDKNVNSLIFKNINSISQLNNMMGKSKNQSKPILLDFYADWCVSCKEMESKVFSNQDIKKLMDNFILLRVDVTKMNDNKKELLKRFNLFGPPAIIFFNNQGKKIPDSKLIGYENEVLFKKRLLNILNLN